MRHVFSLIALLALSSCHMGGDAGLDGMRARLRATDTFHDFEIARSASAASLAQLEGLHSETPENQQLMVELMRAWVMQTELFSLDDLEQAQVNSRDGELLYHQQRVATGFARARLWGMEWLAQRAPPVAASLASNDLETALAQAFDDPEDAEPLVWLGHALLGAELTATERYASRSAAELVLKRSIELDETAIFASAHALLGRHYATQSEPDLQSSRQHFAKAEAIAGMQYLLTEFQRAITYHCRRGDQTAFETSLDDVLKATDPAPEVRLQNASAKRRAQRWLVESKLRQACRVSVGNGS